MARLWPAGLLAWLLWGSVSVSSHAVQNPDEIVVYFPAFHSQDALGRNVSTVLSLQLAQTSRRHPWPANPQKHDFGSSLIRWGTEPLASRSLADMSTAGQQRHLLAQIVIAGKAQRYNEDVVVEVDVALPRYRRESHLQYRNEGELRRDFRRRNLEIWQIPLSTGVVLVDVPRRYFSLSSIVLKPDLVEQFRTANGLAIHDTIDTQRIIGRTGRSLQFIEFNKRLPESPTRVRSGGVEGYVSLPELSGDVSEFADMVGGILQVFRGDWEWARGSFTRVIENPATRVPLRVDALLYRGMVKFRLQEDGLEDILAATELAPYDLNAFRYLIMGRLSSNAPDRIEIAKLLDQGSYLFSQDDEWLARIRAWLNE